MNAIERRDKIKELLRESPTPLSGSHLAHALNVSRQVIVTDIAILRAAGENVESTPQGYRLAGERMCERIFKVHHTSEQSEQELNLFVDCGATVKDVFVSHRAYGTLRAELNIRSRMDVLEFMESIRSGKSSLLSNITDGYHYHTVLAPSEALLDVIENKLWEAGLLAKPLEYEPEEFRANLDKRIKDEEEGTGAKAAE